MRKLLFCAVVLAVVTSCGKDATAPVTPLSTAQADETAAFGTFSMGPGLPGFGGLRGLSRLPDNLKLTADQRAAIQAAGKDAAAWAGSAAVRSRGVSVPVPPTAVTGTRVP